jgi:hypothetical protein
MLIRTVAGLTFCVFFPVEAPGNEVLRMDDAIKFIILA